MDRIPEIKKISQILSDETRLKILLYLLNKTATVSDIVENLHIDQPRISSHLSLLLESKLISVETSGRQRIYRIESANKIDHLLTTIYTFDKTNQLEPFKHRSRQAEKLVQENSPLRQARTCYDHLAGVMGVKMLDLMLHNNWLTIKDTNKRPSYSLTMKGTTNLSNMGIDTRFETTNRRKFAYGCPDWTEQKPHLGGYLGSQILNYLQANKFVSKERSSRIIIVNTSIEDLFKN